MKECALGLSVISFFYLLVMDGYVLLEVKDKLLWMVVIVFFLTLWYINVLYQKRKYVPLWLVVSSNTIAAVAIFVFIIILTFIVRPMSGKHSESVDYLIVVGDRSNEIGTPSVNTAYKLDVVMQYMRNNPNTYIILTGNQESRQKHNIVYVMAKALMDEGIREEYLLAELQARSLKENILYCNAIVHAQIESNRKVFENDSAINAGPVLIAEEEKPISIGMIVGDCSAYRAKELAKKAGLRHFEIFPVRSDALLYPHLILQEVVYIFKDKFIGHI